MMIGAVCMGEWTSYYFAYMDIAKGSVCNSRILISNLNNKIHATKSSQNFLWLAFLHKENTELYLILYRNRLNSFAQQQQQQQQRPQEKNFLHTYIQNNNKKLFRWNEVNRPSCIKCEQNVRAISILCVNLFKFLS